MLCLEELKPGREAVIVKILVEPALRHKLASMGVVPGTRVAALGKSLFGDPLAFAVRGTAIALRRKDARKILVEEVGSGEVEVEGRGR